MAGIVGRVEGRGRRSRLPSLSLCKKGFESLGPLALSEIDIDVNKW